MIGTWTIVLLLIVNEYLAFDLRNHASVDLVNSADVNDVDKIADAIEDEGKQIDIVGNSIDAETNKLESSIEERGKDIDSPSANQKIEEKGKDVDALADMMDRAVEGQGQLIEISTRERDVLVTGSKHALLPGANNSRNDSIDEEREASGDDQIDRQGRLVDKIGEEIERNTRNVLPNLSELMKIGPRQSIFDTPTRKIDTQIKHMVFNSNKNKKNHNVKSSALNKLSSEMDATQDQKQFYAKHEPSVSKKGAQSETRRHDHILPSFRPAFEAKAGNEKLQKRQTAQSLLIPQQIQSRTMTRQVIVPVERLLTEKRLLLSKLKGLQPALYTSNMTAKESPEPLLVRRNEEGKVIIPVEKSKLEKVLMFYYLKRKFPKLVQRFIDEEEEHSLKKQEDYASQVVFPEKEYSMFSRLTGRDRPMAATTSDIQLFHKMTDLFQSDGKNSSGANKSASDSQVQSEMNSETFRKKLKEIDDDLDFFKNITRIVSQTSENNDTRALVQSDDPQARVTSPKSQHSNDIKAAEKECTAGVKCVVKKLVGLLHNTFLENNEQDDSGPLPSKEQVQQQGDVRGGADPYASIGHTPPKHTHPHGEREDEEHHSEVDSIHHSVAASDEGGDELHHHGLMVHHQYHDHHPITHFHGDELHGGYAGHYHDQKNDEEHSSGGKHPHILGHNHERAHGDKELIDEVAELEYMIHHLPDTTPAAHFDQHLHNPVPHHFQFHHRDRHGDNRHGHKHLDGHDSGHHRHDIEDHWYEDDDADEDDHHHHIDVHEDEEHEKQVDEEKAPLVHIEHDHAMEDSEGEDIHNSFEMLSHQGHASHHHHHDDNDEMIDADEMTRSRPYNQQHTPAVAHEGPITTMPVFEDDHHLLNGPGIHDQVDVHYEDEMDAHVKRSFDPPREDLLHEKQDSLATGGKTHRVGSRELTMHDVVARKRFLHDDSHAVQPRGDPYGSIGHYPDLHLHIHELEEWEMPCHGESHHSHSYGSGCEHHEHHLTPLHIHHRHGGYNGHYHEMHGGGGEGDDYDYGHHNGVNSCCWSTMNDFGDHGTHIHKPNAEPEHFNSHIHPAIPHLHEQVEHEHEIEWEPYHDHDDHDEDEHHDDEEEDDEGHLEHEDIHHHPHPEPEHQHSQDHDEHRVVHVHEHSYLTKGENVLNAKEMLKHQEVEVGAHQGGLLDDNDYISPMKNAKRRNTLQSSKLHNTSTTRMQLTTGRSDLVSTKERKTAFQKLTSGKVNSHSTRLHVKRTPSKRPAETFVLRNKRSHRWKFFGHRRHRGPYLHFPEEDVPDNGIGVARLSYLTEKYGKEMTQDIDEGTNDVEEVGNRIEREVDKGVKKVTHISNTIVEAPDYDSHGDFSPSIHEDDVEDEVHQRFPDLTERRLIGLVIKDLNMESFPTATKQLHGHHHKHVEANYDTDGDK